MVVGGDDNGDVEFTIYDLAGSMRTIGIMTSLRENRISQIENSRVFVNFCGKTSKFALVIDGAGGSLCGLL